MKTTFETIDQYHEAQLPEVVSKLDEMRSIIKKAAPSAKECISYGMPAFKGNKVLVYYAASKHHLGFYPTAQPIIVFAEELKPYKTSKGAVQFPYNQPLPVDLITRMVNYRVEFDQNR